MRNPVTVRLQLSAIMAVASLTLSGCFTLVPSSTVDVSIENYGPSPLTVLVRRVPPSRAGRLRRERSPRRRATYGMTGTRHSSAPPPGPSG